MNERKIKFLNAVRILAPHDMLVLQFAECVPAEELPTSPGGAALELVAALEKSRPLAHCPSRARRRGILPVPFRRSRAHEQAGCPPCARARHPRF
jgi:hypothetical protein